MKGKKSFFFFFFHFTFIFFLSFGYYDCRVHFFIFFCANGDVRELSCHGYRWCRRHRSFPNVSYSRCGSVGSIQHHHHPVRQGKSSFFFPYTNNNKSKEGYRVLAAAAARARSYFCYFNLNLPRSCVRAVLAWVAVCARHRPSSKKKRRKKNFHSFSPVYFSFNPLHRRERENFLAATRVHATWDRKGGERTTAHRRRPTRWVWHNWMFLPPSFFSLSQKPKNNREFGEHHPNKERREKKRRRTSNWTFQIKREVTGRGVNKSVS